MFRKRKSPSHVSVDSKEKKLRDCLQTIIHLWKAAKMPDGTISPGPLDIEIEAAEKLLREL